MAWELATCPHAKLRDGNCAIESATKACELTGWKNAYPIDTLAAAHAEAGDFDAAVRSQNRAIELMTDEKKKDGLRKCLELYQQKKPYRQGTR